MVMTTDGKLCDATIDTHTTRFRFLKLFHILITKSNLILYDIVLLQILEENYRKFSSRICGNRGIQVLITI